MENLTRKEYDFVTKKTLTGRFVETLDQGHVVEDVNGVHHFVKKTVHTDLGVSQIIKGSVVMFEKTSNGYDVFALDEREIVEWENTKTITE